MELEGFYFILFLYYLRWWCDFLFSFAFKKIIIVISDKS